MSPEDHDDMVADVGIKLREIDTILKEIDERSLYLFYSSKVEAIKKAVDEALYLW